MVTCRLTINDAAEGRRERGHPHPNQRRMYPNWPPIGPQPEAERDE
jgi:hypothetical protein